MGKNPRTNNNQEITLETAMKNRYSQVTLKKGESAHITLPQGMSIEEALRHMTRLYEESQQEIEVSERVEGYPIDVAHALNLALSDLVGGGRMHVETITTFFGTKIKISNNNFITVDTALGEKETVYVGQFVAPGIEGVMSIGPSPDNRSAVVSGTIKKMNLENFNKLISQTKRRLQTNSLYKGKAWRTELVAGVDWITGQPIQILKPPTFENLSLPNEVILNDDVQTLVETCVLTPIRMREKMERWGESIKRGVLLYGYYGTGKSLTAQYVAVEAVRHGWTFVYCNNIHNLKEVYELAALYEPAVVFGEDIDRLVANGDGVEVFNNVLDGLGTKGRKVMLVVTTNHIDKIPTSTLRQGRLDAHIQYELPTAKTAARMVSMFAGAQLEKGADLTAVGEQLQDQIPAMVKEVVTRAKAIAVPRALKENGGRDLEHPPTITTADLLLAIRTLRISMELMRQQTETKKTFAELFTQQVGEMIVGAATRLQRISQFTTDAEKDFHEDVTEFQLKRLSAPLEESVEEV